MIRSFKYFTIAAGGTPQPLIGTTTSAIVPANSNPDAIFTVPVVDSSMFLAKDYAVLGKPSGTSERILVESVTDSTHIVLHGVLKNAYASGSFIGLGYNINSMYVQCKPGNAGALYIGTKDNMVKATGVFCVALLEPTGAGVQPVEFRDGRSGAVDADDVSVFWVDGTTGDGYLPTLGII